MLLFSLHCCRKTTFGLSEVCLVSHRKNRNKLTLLLSCEVVWIKATKRLYLALAWRYLWNTNLWLTNITLHLSTRLWLSAIVIFWLQNTSGNSTQKRLVCLCQVLFLLNWGVGLLYRKTEITSIFTIAILFSNQQDAWWRWKIILAQV